jgi:hypothetical protein
MTAAEWERTTAQPFAQMDATQCRLRSPEAGALIPGRASKSTAQTVPRLLQRPPVVRFQNVISYQSRPIRRSPQAWQYVLWPGSSWTLLTYTYRRPTLRIGSIGDAF